MSVYLGNNLLAGAIDAANQDGSNITNSFSSNLVTKMSDTANSYMAGLGMPSETYEDLTLGASGTEYTAPASGYFQLYGRIATSGGEISFNNNTAGLGNSIRTTAANQYRSLYIQVNKGDKVSCYHNVTSNATFKFIYAVGSESEYTP